MVFIPPPFHGKNGIIWFIVREIGEDWEVLDSAKSEAEAQQKLKLY